MYTGTDKNCYREQNIFKELKENVDAKTLYLLKTSFKSNGKIRFFTD